MTTPNFSIENLCTTLSNYKLFKEKEDVINELLEYSKCNDTIDAVAKYTELLDDFIINIDKSKLSIKTKNMLKNLITGIISLSGINECQNIIIQEQNNQIVEKNIIINKIHSKYQSERNITNELSSKLKETPKMEIVEEIEAFKPNIDLSITKINKIKPISNKAIVEIYSRNLNNVNNKYKRLSNKNEDGKKIDSNIKTVFGKQSNYQRILEK